jgi:hypothetical protein
LIAPNNGNPKGYFENLDFVELHSKILSFHGAAPEGWTLEADLPVPDHLRQEALSVVAHNEQPGPWGWKDPRTTLFLDFWASELPQARFVFMHRPPWEVVDSLFRRGDSIFQMDPALAVHIWQHYNQLLLNFATRHPNRTLLVGAGSLAYNWQDCLNYIAEHLHISLSVPESSSYDRSLLKNKIRYSHWARLLRELFPQAHELWKQLEQASPPTLRSGFNEDEEIVHGYADLVMRDWMLWRKTELDCSRKTEALEQALYNARSDLYHANTRLQYIERSRIWKLRNRLQAIRTLLR